MKNLISFKIASNFLLLIIPSVPRQMSCYIALQCKYHGAQRNDTYIARLYNTTSILAQRVNRKFKYSFDESFTDIEYKNITLLNDNNKQYGIHNRIVSKIDFIRFLLPEKIKTKDELEITLIPSIWKEIINYLKKNKIDFGETDDSINFPGITIAKLYNNQSNKYIIYMDPFTVSLNLKIIKDLFNILYNNKLDIFYLHVIFTGDVNFQTSKFKITSKLSDIGAKFSEYHGDLYKYKNIYFSIDENKMFRSKAAKQYILRIAFQLNDLDKIDIFALIDLLIDTKIIVIKSK